MSPVAGARYAQQQTTGAPPSVPPVAGYLAWYDPSDAATITSSGGAVSQLNDKSANARHLGQATSGFRPTTGTRTQNGLNVLDYDGTDDFLEVGGLAAVNPFTCFVVALSDVGANSLTGRVLDSYDTNNSSVGKSTANQWNMNGGTALAGGTPDTAAHVHSAVFNGASSSRRVDGAIVASGNAGSSGMVGTRLGRGQGAVVGFWDGWIAEVVIYAGPLNTTDCASVEAYLKAKWNTP